VSSIARFAEFNQKEAGVFEKMSMFKARPVFGKPEVIQGRIAPLFDELLWSRPLDPEELKQGLRMRSRMETELVSPDYHGQKGFHIKWGKGGLLDTEFLVVWILLAFGAGNQGLRAHSTLEGICLLESFEMMRKEDAGFLANHYRFLRMLENRVRLIHDVDVENVDFEDPRFHELMASIMQRLGHQASFAKQGAKSSLLALTRRARALYDRYTLLLQRHLQDGEPDVRRWRASWGLSKNMLKSWESGKQFGRTTTKG
jgi:glutamate-ammonia-ligase adenylyltransferase